MHLFLLYCESDRITIIQVKICVQLHDDTITYEIPYSIALQHTSILLFASVSVNDLRFLPIVGIIHQTHDMLTMALQTWCNQLIDNTIICNHNSYYRTTLLVKYQACLVNHIWLGKRNETKKYINTCMYDAYHQSTSAYLAVSQYFLTH